MLKKWIKKKDKGGVNQYGADSTVLTVRAHKSHVEHCAVISSHTHAGCTAVGGGGREYTLR